MLTSPGFSLTCITEFHTRIRSPFFRRAAELMCGGGCAPPATGLLLNWGCALTRCVAPKCVYRRHRKVGDVGDLPHINRQSKLVVGLFYSFTGSLPNNLWKSLWSTEIET